MMRIHAAFTLIELLVVVAIMAMLSSLIMIVYEERAEDAVSASAHDLQSVLQRARSLAMRHGRMHAVAFHIENYGDGTVLKNNSYNDEITDGKHWFCIIGPDSSNYRDRRTTEIPYARPNSFFSIKDYMQAMDAAQIGPRYYLHAGTRFLALGDVDSLYPHSTYEDESYPRPWFGYFDEASGTLYPWGAYNRDIDAALPHPNSGLDYAGNDGEIAFDIELDTNVNPAQVWGRVHKDASAQHPLFISSGASDYYYKKHYRVSRGYVGPDTSFLASTPSEKKPRPLVNALWADFVILFDETGAAFAVSGHGRSQYFSDNRLSSNSYSPYQKTGPTPYGRNSGREHMGIEHFNEQTGGFYITICRDVDDSEEIYRQHNPATQQPAYHKFASKEDAFASITPFVRVFINQSSGVAEIRDNQFPGIQISAEDLLAKDPYPRGFK